MYSLYQTVISLVAAVFLSTGVAWATPNYGGGSLYVMAENGVMKIDTSTGAYSQLNSIGTNGNAAALTYGDGSLYAMTTNAILKIDISTGAYNYLNSIGTNGYFAGLVYGDGSLYAMTTNAILKIDTSTGAYDYLNGIGTYGNSRELVYVNAVPEPETFALLLTGFGLLGGIARRTKQQ